MTRRVFYLRLSSITILIGCSFTAYAEFRVTADPHPNCSIVSGFTLYSEYRSFKIAASHLELDARLIGANTAFLSEKAYEIHHRDVVSKEAQLKIKNPNLIIDPNLVAVNPAWKNMVQFQGLLLDCPDFN